MAMLAPLLPSLVGGAGALSGLATFASISSTLIGGISQSRQIKSQAKVERFNATNREIERKQNLARSLAIQNVRQGASGVGAGGSAKVVQENIASDSSFAQVVDDAGTQFRVSQLEANARDATTSSLLSAGSEAFKFGSRRAKRGRLNA